MQKAVGKKKTIFIIIAVVIIAVVACVAFYFARSNAAENTPVSNTGGFVVSQDAENWNGTVADASEGQQGIKIPGYGEITVPANEKDWNITLLNPEGNTCYFKYSITIGEEETPIYESDLIEPGKAIKSFEVTEGLEAGDYEIHLRIATYTMDEDQTQLNGANVKATLHVI